MMERIVVLDHQQAQLPDAPSGNWVDLHAPLAWKPYLRLMRADRPIGTWLLLIPCWWGSGLAGLDGGTISLAHLALFALGAFVMRGAGCVWNDITDRDIDAKVERTMGRPLPSGAVSLKKALLFMGVLATIGLAVLLQFNQTAIITGIASLGIVALYPFMKRITDFPQFVLGLAFNWGVLVAWAAVHGSLAIPPLLLYAAGVAWTLGYDTVYALQDIEDDAIVGVRSTARFFGPKVMPAIIAFYAAATGLVLLALASAGAHLPSFLGAAGFAALLARQTIRLDPADPRSALLAFRANRLAGLALFVGMAADVMLGSA